MIGGDDIYKVVTAMMPLYVALVLGYGSVKWWHMFKPDHCNAINRFNCYFIIPFFTFEFVAHVNPYKMNYRFLSADVIAKSMVGIVLALWANCSKNGNFSWSITTFSLSSLNNSLVIGVPLLKAMYGELGFDLVVQSFVIQSLLWFIALLFLLEMRRARSQILDSQSVNGDAHVSSSVEIEMGRDSEGITSAHVVSESLSFLPVMKIVWVKLAKNPNSYACIIGLIWALLSNRWHFQMPEIIEGSILIMSKAGAGVAMFSMGLFMALQERFIACGVGLTLYGMVLRFVVGPATIAIGSVAMGLHGDVLRIAVIQAALPQSITSFVYAQEYGLHATELSTAVIFGTVASLPLLIGYYAILDILH
ncbi:hypothetical protein ACH5RR_016166 [Cinchona calisaya]|uniref:Auxin efflux carrier component n=1 Tax=Cinchona calisaya TaxID=153742 RepID=A0ABD2ZV73_9GENT